MMGQTQRFLVVRRNAPKGERMATAAQRITEEDRTVREAVLHGVDHRHMGEIDEIGREALVTFIETIDDLLSVLGVDEGTRLRFAGEYAACLASDGTWGKLFAAFYVEGDMTDGEIVANGILGRAIDQAIDDMLPYATRGGGGWYNQASANGQVPQV